MRRLFPALLLLMPLSGYAAGSWSLSRAGGQLYTGGQQVISPALNSPTPLPAGSRVTQLSWRITLLPAAPPGFQAKLCTPQRCVTLPGLQGTLRPTTEWQAQGPFTFVYSVAVKGRLSPSLTVVSNQLAINYHQAGKDALSALFTADKAP